MYIVFVLLLISLARDQETQAAVPQGKKLKNKMATIHFSNQNSYIPKITKNYEIAFSEGKFPGSDMNYYVVSAIKFHSLSLVKNNHVMRHDSFVKFGDKYSRWRMQIVSASWINKGLKAQTLRFDFFENVKLSLMPKDYLNVKFNSKTLTFQ
jgi:hypothetical protein